jgi:predicted nucleic acid-binding protein
VDSCGWLEYLTGGPNASFFKPPIGDTRRLVVPTICIFEVFKQLRTRYDRVEALEGIAFMRQGMVVDLDLHIALRASVISIELKLPMADSIILATARARKAVIWTQDKDFKGIEGVKYIKKK